MHDAVEFACYRDSKSGGEANSSEENRERTGEGKGERRNPVPLLPQSPLNFIFSFSFSSTHLPYLKAWNRLLQS